ncbi:MAG: hypothetical protein DSM106950_41225 [Stigonema ocellatum SAG 48.90 = DSM 106950]|nr:hypothetical protein [Stigonema ocellatum SAG 48.90 = DSM 106950]
MFSHLVSDEPQVISNLPPSDTNTVLLTTINNSDTVENTTPAQNKEDTSPSDAKPKTDFDSFPAPQGFATGGHVTTTYTENPQQIAPSDTVPAMLTPGEFVINARDAQKHLNLLKHINTGGTASDIVLPREETSNGKEQQQTTSVESPTKVDSLPETSLQRTKTDNISSQVSNSLSSSSLGLEIQKQRRSILSSPEINTFDTTTTHSDVGQSSNQYSSPSLIFRQKNPSPSTHTPSQWSSVEELLNASTNDFTVFNSGGAEFKPQNSEFSHVAKSPSESPQIFAKRLPQPQGFADGGEVTKIDATIQPITETIQRRLPTSPSEDDNADLEVLAREIYSRLRQRLEIERERYGVHSGRLPW